MGCDGRFCSCAPIVADGDGGTPPCRLDEESALVVGLVLDEEVRQLPDLAPGIDLSLWEPFRA